MQSKLIALFTQLSLHYCRSNPKHSWRNRIKASSYWVSLIVLGLDILIRHIRVSPTQTAVFILLLLPIFFFFWIEWLIIQTCTAEKKKQSLSVSRRNVWDLASRRLLTWEWQNTTCGRIKCTIRPFSLISDEYLNNTLQLTHSVLLHTEAPFIQDKTSQVMTERLYFISTLLHNGVQLTCVMCFFFTKNQHVWDLFNVN